MSCEHCAENDRRLDSAQKALLDAGHLHLADESTIFQLEAKLKEHLAGECGGNDYKDMRRFQSEFMKADHKARDLELQVRAFQGIANALYFALIDRRTMEPSHSRDEHDCRECEIMDEAKRILRGAENRVEEKCAHHVSRVFGTDGKQTVCSWCGADVTEKRKCETGHHNAGPGPVTTPEGLRYVCLLCGEIL